MQNNLVKQQVNSILSAEDINTIIQFEEFKVKAKILIEEKSELLKEFFRANGIDSFENDDVKITYVHPTTRKVVDSAKLKEDGIYEKYLKITEVGDSIKIKPKYE